MAVDEERLDAHQDGAEFAGVHGAALAVRINEAQGAAKRVLLIGIAGRMDSEKLNLAGAAQKAIVLQNFPRFRFFPGSQGGDCIRCLRGPAGDWEAG